MAEYFILRKDRFLSVRIDLWPLTCDLLYFGHPDCEVFFPAAHIGADDLVFWPKYEGPLKDADSKYKNAINVQATCDVYE